MADLGTDGQIRRVVVQSADGFPDVESRSYHGTQRIHLVIMEIMRMLVRVVRFVMDDMDFMDSMDGVRRGGPRTVKAGL
ncbi:MAG: hypothetical protein AMXMBFR82_08380 [Candidatus Hydrogenedentota bacterium]